MLQASSVPVSIEPIGHSVCGLWPFSWACSTTYIVNDIWVTLTTGAVSAMVFVGLLYLETAITAIVEERSSIDAERAAFLSFQERVATATIDRESSIYMTPVGGAALTTLSESTSKRLEYIQEAYRDTVMAVPHYEADYGETLAENMTNEFGKATTEAVVHGDRFSPLLKEMLVTQSESSVELRRRSVGSLDREEAHLRNAATRFASIEASLESFRLDLLRVSSYLELIDRWEELEDLEDDCIQLLEARQRHLQADRWVGTPEHDFSTFEYMYRTLPVRLPILASGVLLINQIEVARRAIVKVAYERV